MVTSVVKLHCGLMLVALLMMLSGCLIPFEGIRPYKYDTVGQLYDANGALKPLRVYLSLGRDHQYLCKSDLQRIIRREAVTSDANGVFRYFLGYAGSPYSPPHIDKVYVYVEQADGWHVYEKTLDEDKQDRTEQGRRIVVPPIVIGRDPVVAIVNIDGGKE